MNMERENIPFLLNGNVIMVPMYEPEEMAEVSK